MNEWPTVGSLTTNLNRRRVPLSGIERAKRQGPYRYFGAQGVIDHIDEFIFDGEFILVAEDGENLRSRKQPIAFLVDGRFWVNNHAHILEVNEELADPRFLVAALNATDLGGYVTGAAQPKLTKENLHRIALPPLDKSAQSRVGAFLGAFDELIAINDRRIELLENLARSFYREWFVRFRAPGTSAVEGRELPSGWTVAPLGDVATLNYGKALPAGTRRPGPVAVVSSAGVIDEHDVELVEGPGVVLGRKGNVGSVWWIDRPFFPIDTTYYVDTDMPLGLLYWQLRDMTFIDSHAAVPGLSRDYVYGLPVVVPADDVAARFAEIHQVLFDEISLLRRQTSALGATRDLLLPRLLSGQLDISDVDLGDLLTEDAT